MLQIRPSKLERAKFALFFFFFFFDSCIILPHKHFSHPLPVSFRPHSVSHYYFFPLGHLIRKCNTCCHITNRWFQWLPAFVTVLSLENAQRISLLKLQKINYKFRDTWSNAWYTWTRCGQIWFVALNTTLKWWRTARVKWKNWNTLPTL